MLRQICVAAALAFAFTATAFADTVTLKARVETQGPAITLGDVFDGVPGDVARRAIAPAPPAGQVSTLSVPLLSAVASAAGLEWTAPGDLREVRVVHPGGMRATVPAAQTQSGGRMLSDAAVHRGETISLVFRAPGMSITTRARALEDAAVGQSVRLVNLTSNRTIEGVVTAPGVADAGSQ